MATRVLLLLAATVTLARADEPSRLRAAIAKALPLIATSATTYTEQRDCFSCHHQTLPALAWADVRRKGFDIDAAVSKKQADFTRDYFAARKEKLIAGEGVPGGAYSAGYALAGLAAEKVAADKTTAALVEYLRKTQRDDGGWRIQGGSHRPPLEDSHFTATALALAALRGPFASATEDAAVVERGMKWLREHEATSTEDAVFRLLGLVEARADEKTIDGAVAELLKRRRDDGGWGQETDSASDAYATGTALTALAAAKNLGREVEADVFRRGRTWLLEAQLPDGSWKVETRAKPFQEYFESGYPHAKSQFISIAAACRAVQSLAAGL